MAGIRQQQRSLSVASALPEAFLEPVGGEKGVVALTLNRPSAKNAISVKLLKVRLLLRAYHLCRLFVADQRTNFHSTNHFSNFATL